MIWEELVRTALLGVERTPLSAATLAHLKTLGINVEENTDTQNILEAVAYYAQLQKIDFQLVKSDFTLPKKAKKSSAAVKYMDVTTASLLEKIINKYHLAIEEFSLLAQENEQFIPPEKVPICLNIVREKDNYWDSIAPMLDENGWWLLDKNKYWKFLKNRPYKPVEILLDRIYQSTRSLKDFRDSLANGRTYLDNSDWQAVKRAAFFADLNQYDDLTSNWDENALHHPIWNSNLSQLFDILEFRKNMIQSIQSA